MKNPMTPAAIEPGTFRFVAQHLSHCPTAVPLPAGTCRKVNCSSCGVQPVAVWFVKQLKCAGDV